MALGVLNEKYKPGIPKKSKIEVKKFVLKVKEIKTESKGEKIKKTMSKIFLIFQVSA